MKVIVNETVFTIEDNPIALVLSPSDKKCIANMDAQCNTIAFFDNDYWESEDEKNKWFNSLPEK